MTYYDRTGVVIDANRWCELHEQTDYLRVALTVVSPTLTVSTVWLGFDRSLGPPGGPPGSIEIFETMVFGDGIGEECVRYATEAEALVGHDEMVERMRSEDFEQALSKLSTMVRGQS